MVGIEDVVQKVNSDKAVGCYRPCGFVKFGGAVLAVHDVVLVASTSQGPNMTRMHSLSSGLSRPVDFLVIGSVDRRQVNRM